MQILRASAVVVVACSAVVLGLACGDSAEPAPSSSSSGGTVDAGPRGVEPAGQSCTAASQCYAQVDGGADSGAIVGTVTCLDRVENGYCTHTCTQDTECCAAPGECLGSVKQVCSPFENQTTKYCFLSCEDADIQRAIAANADAGYYDGGTTEAGTAGDAYCQSFAGAATSCRSSGGGNQNRKVCIPNE